MTPTAPDEPSTGGEADGRLATELRLEIAKARDEIRSEIGSALASQEHRLLPAVTGLIHAILSLRGKERRKQIVAFSGSVLWCLIPSAGTASVGLVAVFSLLIALQQARLLSAQNEKIEVQNILAEAQRRSSLIYETTALMALIEEEKRNASSKGKGEQLCRDSSSFGCWLSSETETPAFVPSRATLGRLAALTRALRPYRYLSVEDSSQYRFIGRETLTEVCTESFQSEPLRASRNLIERAAYGSAHEDAELLKIETLRKYIVAAYDRASPWDDGNSSRAQWRGTLDKAFQIFGISTVDIPGIRVNCAPASPERGQLLISLHAAGVDISRVATAGGDFRYADIPGAQLKDIRLNNVDLSYARLPNSSFERGYLERVKFDHAHLANVSFRDATLISVSFDEAVIQSANDGAASSNLFGPVSASGNILAGLKFVDIDGAEDLIDRICTAGSLVSRLDRKTMRLRPDVRELAMMTELRRFALLVERKQDAPGTSQGRLVAVIVPKTVASRETLFGSNIISGRPTVTLEYAPFDTCHDWPPPIH